MSAWKRDRSCASAPEAFTSRIPDSVSRTCAFTSPARSSTRRSPRRSFRISGPHTPMVSGTTRNAATVSFHESASISTIAARNSKNELTDLDTSRVTSERSCSTSWVSRDTICPIRVRPKKPRSSSSR